MSQLSVCAHLFVQLCLLLCVCRALGWLGQRYLGQTKVFMELIAGIVLGPSLLGMISPSLQSWLFPAQWIAQAGSAPIQHPNMSILYALAQVGLVLYMFVIGLEFDPSVLRGRAASAGMVSGAGILVPFAVAAPLVSVLKNHGGLFAAGVTTPVAWLFVGTSISITAFPMLARILDERGISATKVGTLTLAAASIDDAVAWCLLALVLAMVGKAADSVFVTAGLTASYGVFMLTFGRRWFRRFEQAHERTGQLSGDLFTSVMAILMLCAFITDLIGVHAVFGAFVFGVAMPKGKLGHALTVRIEQLTTSLFLPAFFVYSGLNTKLDLVDSMELWGLATLTILISTLAKGVACTLAARVGGESWRESMLIGNLMNARGMTELIILNVGLSQGVISPTFFTIMVIMAVVTTAVASPMHSLLSRGMVLRGSRAPGSARTLDASGNDGAVASGLPAPG